MRKDTLVIAVGETGKNLIMGCMNYNTDVIKRAEYLVLSIGHSVFPASIPEVVLDGRIDVQNVSNIQQTKMMCAENRNSIMAFSREKSAVIIVAGTDDASIGAVMALSIIFKTEDIMTFCFLQEPFATMHSLHYKNMMDNISLVRKNCGFTNVLSNHLYLEGVSSIEDCYNYMVRFIIDMITGISMVSNKKDKNVIESGIEEFLEIEMDGETYAGIGVGFGDNAIVTSIESALCSTISNVKLINPQDVMIILHGEISLLEINEAVTIVEQVSDDDTRIGLAVIYEECRNQKIETIILAKNIEGGYEICR